MATKTIGTTGRDYSTIAAWITYLEALTFSGDETGQLFNDAEFTVTAALVFDGANIDNTGAQKVILTTGTGQGFGDHANKATNALRYNASNGVGVRLTSGSVDLVTMSNSMARLEFRGIQFKKDTNYSYALNLISGGAGLVVDRCIIEAAGGTSALRLSPADGEIRSCLIRFETSGGAGPAVDSVNGTNNLRNCTIARSTSAGAGSSVGVTRTYGTANCYNCAIFGFNAASSGTVGGDHNATNNASVPGTSGITSQTYANQFEVVTQSSADYRHKAGNALDGAGANANGFGIDIISRTRPATYAIGAWDTGVAPVAVRVRSLIFT